MIRFSTRKQRIKIEKDDDRVLIQVKEITKTRINDDKAEAEVYFVKL